MTSHTAPTVVGVSVVSYRSTDATVAFVRSAIHHRGSSELRVCCVDNGEDADELERLDDALAALACPSVEIVTIGAEANLGYGGGHNLAARWLLDRGVGVVLVANPDVVVESGSLSGLAEQVLDAPSTIFGATTVEEGREYSGTAILNPWTSRSRTVDASDFGGAHAAPSEVHFVKGHFLAMAAPRWRLLGGFAEPYFLYFEEADLAVRARRDGGTVATARDLVVAHAQGLTTNPDRSADTRKSRTTIYHSTRSALIFTRLHFRWRLPVVVTARLVYGVALRASNSEALGTVLSAIRRGLARGATNEAPR